MCFVRYGGISKPIFVKFLIGVFFVCFFLARQPPPPPVGQGLLIHEVSRSHSTTHHSRLDSSGRVISSSQRPLPHSTQHSQQTDIHAPLWDSNPQSQKASDRKPTPLTARLLGPTLDGFFKIYPGNEIVI